MKTSVRSSILAIVLAMAPSFAYAQRTPYAGMGAVGGDIGVFIPASDSLDNSLNLEGFYEYYFTSRASMRLGAGWMNPEFAGTDDLNLRYVRLFGDFVRNWEGGTVHPFVGAGLGVYFLQEKLNGDDFRDSETKLGATIFGGAEFFLDNTTSVKGEAKYHFIDNIENPGGARFNPDGLALTIGLKKYF